MNLVKGIAVTLTCMIDLQVVVQLFAAVQI